jgi:hypothetical protein
MLLKKKGEERAVLRAGVKKMPIVFQPRWILKKFGEKISPRNLCFFQLFHSAIATFITAFTAQSRRS